MSGFVKRIRCPDCGGSGVAWGYPRQCCRRCPLSLGIVEVPMTRDEVLATLGPGPQVATALASDGEVQK